MKNLKLRKAIAVSLAIVSVLALNTGTASAECKKDSNEYYNIDSDSVSGWQVNDGKYYFYTMDGTMVKDTTVDGYYLDSDGVLDTTKGQAPLQNMNMRTEKKVYPLGTKKVKVSFINNTGMQCGCDAYYRVDKWENGKWNRLEFSQDIAFEEIQIIMPAGIKCEDTYKLSTLEDFEDLTPGKYRIVKEMANSEGYTHVAAEFELQ